ncbi:MAG: 3-deoxy-7-phosphoheptulonate synthase, partial [Opitutae bacterium]|nr:3-deoxy-7-phosphoheptulonate synthase [Opitutae bacterium]
SPYAFQGLGVEGLRYLAEERSVVGLPIITEVMDTRDVEMVAEFADIIQVGARNMQNFNLLKVLGRCNRPVMLKRGLASTLEELLMSAEYVINAGNDEVILCERGIRTFETFTRNTLDLSAVPVLKRESHLPVVVDPSHGTGHWDLVAPMAKAAVAAGADGLLLEVHPDPSHAVSDGPQSLTPKRFKALMGELELVARAVGRNLH